MPVVPFPHKLILNRYIMSQFGGDATDLEGDLFRQVAKNRLTDETLESRKEDGRYAFHDELVGLLNSDSFLTAELLLEYDANIARHTDYINRKRSPKIEWKYFQYLSLLFTEIYLDQFFSNRDGLLDDLNRLVNKFNQVLLEWGEKRKADRLSLFTENGLRKLAFWNATGSGKTLLMHINVLQFQHYMKKHKKLHELNRIVVLTPNEGLTDQHLEEFRKSGMRAVPFNKNSSGSGLLSSQEIDVIDMNKLREESGKKTVSVDQFETNNLVLIDEGHRGASGDVWFEMRRRLAQDGFTFEYSATLGQAVSGNTGLADDYAKCILFDYSYRYFHSDGFGKDYNILNIEGRDENRADEENRHLYLSACLLSFYQQLRLFDERQSAYKAFDIDRPLWVFVGSKVTAVRKENKRDVSDVVDILLFLSEFISNKTRTLANIEKLMSGDTGLLNEKNTDIFSEAFPYLIQSKDDATALYNDIMSRLFNSYTGGMLHIDYLKGGDGELALRVGDSDDHFGVINVGDAKKLFDLCQNNDLDGKEIEFSHSLFKKINEKSSKLNLLIGSKRFTEGWNSFRVATMGLMFVGQREGSEIIQLFGRGVRLRGFENSLKRSKAIHWSAKDGEYAWVPKDDDLPILETLNVFGVKSDYMARFNEFLEGEGIKKPEDRVEYKIPVRFKLPKTSLITVSVPEGINFKKQAKTTLALPPSEFLPKRRVTLDWYPRVKSMASRGVKQTSFDTSPHEDKLRERHIAFMDIENIYFEMQRLKAERNWHNFNMSKEAVIALLRDPHWYTLYIPEERLSVGDFSRVVEWEEIAISLLKKFCDRFYKFQKEAFEAPHREYRELDPADPNFFDEYKVLVDQSEKLIIQRIEELQQHINDGTLGDFNIGGKGEAFVFDQHLYSPLLHLKKGVDADLFKISPVHLNEGERDFVMDLRDFYQTKPSLLEGREIYLLRNQSKGRGIGFFEAGNFYPDFILWIIEGEKQHIVFVDPKGIMHCEGIDDPKLRFYETVKDIEIKMRTEGSKLSDKVTMNSFIVSNTPLANVRWWKPDLATSDDFADRHVLFQNEDKDTYIDKLFRAVLV